MSSKVPPLIAVLSFAAAALCLVFIVTMPEPTARAASVEHPSLMNDDHARLPSATITARRPISLTPIAIEETSVPVETPTPVPPTETPMPPTATPTPPAPESDAECIACHMQAAAPATANRATAPQAPQAVQVTTHGNMSYSGKFEMPFFLGCTQCHESHGNTGNIYTIKQYVKIQSSPLITTGPVVFTATTGIGSFDYNDPNTSPTNRICTTCHVDARNPGYPLAHHAGGAGHVLNSADYVNQNCLNCHPHNGTGKTGVYDGFMPVGGCTQCHAVTTDDPSVAGPVGGRRAIVPEFKNAANGIRSHHVLSTTSPTSATVTDADCRTCHVAELAAHADGYVNLTNVDTGAAYTETTPGAFRPGSLTLADAKSLTPFCLACHDTDGATTLGATRAITPFSDGLVVPNVAGTDITSGMWSTSAHATGGSTNTGYGCMSCHDNGHGSNLDNLIGPYTSTVGVGNYNEEEGFCYKCHNGSPVATNIRTEFNLSSHHMVSDTEQFAGTRGRGVIECANCHDVHRSNSTQPLVNPDNRSVLWNNALKGERDFCLACHDGTPPTTTYPLAFMSQYPVSFTALYSGTGFNKSAYISSTHDIKLSGPECRACHERHGATTYSLLSKAYNKTYPATYSAANYALCYTCHRESLARGSNAFGSRHTSISQHNVPCIHCHDAHNSYDPGERGLMNFSYATTWFAGFTLINGTTQSTAYRAGTGNNMTCGSFQCHNTDTHSKSYTPAPIYTTSCGNCHNTATGTAPVRRQVIDSAATGAGTGGEFYKTASIVNISYHLTPTVYNTSTARNTIMISDCTVCHEFSTHTMTRTNKYMGLKDPDSLATIKYTYTVASTAYDKAVQLQGFCQGCHDGDGATRLGAKALRPFNDNKLAVIASVHSNVNFAGRQEAPFTVTCVQCHANTNHGSSNIKLITTTLVVTGATTTGPINFKTFTGTNSFDDGVSAAASRVCVSCHANASNPGYPMVSHTGGAVHLSGSYTGVTCLGSGCHLHDADNNPATLDGFMR